MRTGRFRFSMAGLSHPVKALECPLLTQGGHSQSKKEQNTFMKCRFARNSDSVCMSVACRRSKLRVEARGAFIMGLGESL